MHKIENSKHEKMDLALSFPGPFKSEKLKDFKKWEKIVTYAYFVN